MQRSFLAKKEFSTNCRTNPYREKINCAHFAKFVFHFLPLHNSIIFFSLFSFSFLPTVGEWARNFRAGHWASSVTVAFRNSTRVHQVCKTPKYRPSPPASRCDSLSTAFSFLFTHKRTFPSDRSTSKTQHFVVPLFRKVSKLISPAIVKE